MLPTATSLGSLNYVWGSGRRILGAGVSFSLSFTWLLPPQADAIKELRLLPLSVLGFVPISVFVNKSVLCLSFTIETLFCNCSNFCSSVRLLVYSDGLSSIVDVAGLLQQVCAMRTCLCVFSQVFSRLLLTFT